MKKKIILGVFALTSIIAFAQSTDDTSGQSESKFWGTQCHSARSREGKSSTVCCYYVFWVNTGCKEVG